MKPTDQTLNEQLRITEREIESRKKLLGIDPGGEALLREVKPLVVADLDGIVESFYETLVELDGVAQLIGDAESLFRLKIICGVFADPVRWCL